MLQKLINKALSAHGIALGTLAWIGYEGTLVLNELLTKFQ